MEQGELQGFKLSPQQMRWWALWRGRPESSTAVGGLLRLEGELDPARLGQALEMVVGRHEILSTSFRLLPGLKQPVQVPDAGASPTLVHTDLAAGEADLEDFLAEQLAAPFDLGAGPNLRCSLVRLAAHSHAVVLALAPLCGDRTTLGNLARELASAYAGELAEDSSEVFQYSQFSAWRNSVLEDDEEEELRQFWADDAEDLPPDSRLPGQLVEGDGAAAGQISQPMEVHRRELSAPLTARIDVWVGEGDTSFEGFLLAGWQALLMRLSGESEVVVAELYDFRDEEILADALGLFACNLPVRVRRRAEQRFRELWSEVEARREAVRDMAEGFIWGGVKNIAAGHAEPISWGFEFIDEITGSTGGGIRFDLVQSHATVDNYRLRLAAWRQDDRVVIELGHDPRYFDGDHVLRLADQLEAVLEAVSSDPEQLLVQLPWTSSAERQRLTLALQPAAVGAPQSFLQHFAGQVEKRPQAPAVRFEDRLLSYAELDKAAAELATRLRRQGVGVDFPVALGLERSTDLIVAMLAVLRAGGAYVVIDPDQPAQRLHRMLEAVAIWQGAERALTIGHRDQDGRLPEEATRWLWIDDPAADAVPVSAPTSALSGDREPDAEQLAYVVFTSGSTGSPKGVAIAHRHLDAYLEAAVERLDLPDGGSYASVSTFAADLGNTMLLPALAGGGCLHVVSAERAADPQALAEYLVLHEVDCLKIVPSHLEALLTSGVGAGLLPRRRLVLGGEAFPWSLAERLGELAPELRLFNHYGPSETTVGVLAGDLASFAPDQRLATVPIGRPLPGARAYVLGGLEPLPVWSPGELHIGGASVGRGYLGQPAQTAEVFVPDPFAAEAGARLYRSGDLARHLPTGDLEFIGRRDQQVKLHGFRVELGEIRAALRQHEQIRDAVVVVADDAGRPTVLAYYVSRQPIDAGELREMLRDQLLEAAVPKLFYRLKRLPLTLNGKLDYAALPGVEEVRRESAVERELIEPRNPVEQALTEVWRELLRVDELSVDDNFFELGGDSILAIQVTARANRLGYSLKPQQIFLHPTVEQLALVAADGQQVDIDQGPVEGESPLVPIQRWFFDQQLSEPEHWNQPLMFELPEALAGDVLRSLIGRLTTHHDALRARFERRGDEVVAIYDGLDSAPPPAVVLVDLRWLEPDLRPAAIETLAAQAQRSLDLYRGPLLRAVQFDLGEGGARLLLVLHHLVVDVVSWQVLAEDLATLGQGLATGGKPTLPAKTTSYRSWAERLVEYGSTTELAAELDYWQAAAQPTPADLPVDRPGGVNTVGSVATVTEVLDQELTRALLQEVPSTFRSQINDALLSALARALGAWTGSDDLWIEMEGHGREDLFDDVDLTRTVGWFTSMYPVRLRLGGKATAEPAEALAQVKEQLAAVPRRGIGYGVLRASESGSELARQPRPQLKLNYLGQLGSGSAEQAGAGQIGQAAESSGPARSQRSARAYLLEIDSEVLDGELRMHWRYSRAIHRRSTLERLARDFRDRLAELAGSTGSASSVAAAAADFPLAGLDADRLDKVAAALERLGDGTAASEER